MSNILQLLETSLDKVLLAFAHNWIYLLASILVGSLIKLFLDKDRVAAYLRGHQEGGVVLATAIAVGTPLCSCGTTAIVIGMMASLVPWAPIVAFMVSSPLSSPEGLFYTAGLFGWPFALAGFIGSILLGLAGGWVAGWLERNGWLKNQARLNANPEAQDAPVSQPSPARAACSCQPSQLLPAVVLAAPDTSGRSSVKTPLTLQTQGSCGCQSSQSIQSVSKTRPTLQMAARQILQDAPRLLVMFFSFAFLGYLLNGLIPDSWVTGLFGSGHVYGVPLAATLGLPFYINSEASLPMVRAMLDSGMSQGAALAFLISGAGTSFGAIGGALSIARWRVITIVVGTLWVGAMMVGFLFDLFLASGLN
jgi:uncharacterized membrane protein YraQ (UPF0718 family)